MSFRDSILILLLVICCCCFQAPSVQARSSGFSIALKTLQNQINYKFDKIDLLRRAMTHSSYSQENNKGLSILGERVMETCVLRYCLVKDIDITAKDLNNNLAEISASCASDGLRLGLHNIVRVSKNTNSSTPAVVCATFRSIFGAIALDEGNSDDAETVFWYVHGGGTGSMAM